MAGLYYDVINSDIVAKSLALTFGDSTSSYEKPISEDDKHNKRYKKLNFQFHALLVEVVAERLADAKRADNTKDIKKYEKELKDLNAQRLEIIKPMKEKEKIKYNECLKAHYQSWYGLNLHHGGFGLGITILPRSDKKRLQKIDKLIEGQIERLEKNVDQAKTFSTVRLLTPKLTNLRTLKAIVGDHSKSNRAKLIEISDKLNDKKFVNPLKHDRDSKTKRFFQRLLFNISDKLVERPLPSGKKLVSKMGVFAPPARVSAIKAKEEAVHRKTSAHKKT
jgi:hypothetical protein